MLRCQQEPHSLALGNFQPVNRRPGDHSRRPVNIGANLPDCAVAFL
jgi:hypothetical protein